MSEHKNLFPKLQDIPPAYRISPSIIDRYLVNGELKKWNGNMAEVYSPVYLQREKGLKAAHVATYASLDEDAAMAALQSAVDAHQQGRGQWACATTETRIQHVEQFTYHMKEKRDEVINKLMWGIGKNLPDSAKEFDRTVQYINDTIDALKNLDRESSRFIEESGIIAQVRRAPIGPTLVMGPYNYPLNETFALLIPALLMGNTVVFRPPELGVNVIAPLLEAFRDSFPPGVINIIFGRGRTLITPIMESGKIDVFSFIGSSSVARKLKQLHPHPQRLRSVTGMDANNAGIVLEDADLEVAVQETITGTLSFNGQRCTALKVLFVHKNISEAFTQRYTEMLSELKKGMPWEEGVRLTPLPEPEKPEYLTGLIQDAREKGAKVINKHGGEFDHSYFHPAVLFPVSENMKVLHEEQFGPIVPIVEFDDIEQPLRAVVESDYGQQVSIFGTDSETIAQLVDPLVNQVCRVNINAQCQRGPDTLPFNGRRDSAEGTLSVSDALRSFSIRALVATKQTQANETILKEIVTERKSNFLSTDFIF